VVELEDFIGNEPEQHNAYGMVLSAELSNKRIRNINAFVTPGQKMVLLVTKVDEEKGQVDLSLRQVSQENRSQILAAWKQEQKAEQQLLFIGENILNLNDKDAYETVGYPLIDVYGSLRSAYEAIKEDGLEALEDLTISEDAKSKIVEFINSHVQLSFVNITVEYGITCPKGNGVEIIRSAFEKVEDMNVLNSLEVTFSYIGAPRYRCEIKARDYPLAEKTLSKITATLTGIIVNKNKGTVDEYRENLSHNQKT
jgi:translation initiation factor 2 subunit 1